MERETKGCQFYHKRNKQLRIGTFKVEVNNTQTNIHAKCSLKFSEKAGQKLAYWMFPIIMITIHFPSFSCLETELKLDLVLCQIALIVTDVKTSVGGLAECVLCNRTGSYGTAHLRPNLST